MKRIILVAVGAVVVLASVVFGVKWAVYGRYIQSTDNAYVKADTVVISAKTPGRIAAVLAADNAMVRAGDPLVRIESDDYAARVRQAKAERDARRAAIETINKQITLNEAKIADAGANVKSVEADKGLLSTDYNRVSELAKSKVASAQALDKATSALKSGAARLDSANASLDAAKAEAAVLSAQREQSRADLAAAEAKIDLAEIDEANAVIRAPKDGVVGNVSVRAGEYAATGRQLMALVPVEDAYIMANFKETQIARIRAGEKVSIEIDAYPDAEIVGVVDSLSPSSGAEFSLLPPENATGNFTKIVQRLPVKIRITENQQNMPLLPGLSVTASIDTRGADLKSAALFAPREDDETVALVPPQ